MKTRIFVLAALVILTIFLLLVLLMPAPESAEPVSLSRAVSPTQYTPTDTNQSLSPSQTDALADENKRLAQELVDTYGTTISDRAVQVTLLQLRDALLQNDATNGRARFEHIIRLAFPELADQIFESVALMETYRHWLDDIQPELVGLDQFQQDAMLWTKRHELFGEAAERIWTAEREAIAKKQRQIQATIERLDKALEISLEEKVFQLETALDEAYGDLGSEVLITPPQTAQVYFGLDSVQSVLQELPPEARQTKIRELRLRMGFSEAEAESLAQRDEKRNDRWDSGLSYMTQRQDLEARFEGEQLDSALEDLRKEAFGREAATIAKEEAAGFFRFKRPRLYGRN